VAIIVLGSGSCTAGGSPSRSNVTPSVTQVVSVPPLVGLSVDEAQERLNDVGLELGRVEVVTGAYTQAAIVEQHPSPGRSVSLGTAVNVVSGPAAAAG
jgi:beta-lactam-binding protein with PASTA domain